MMSVMPRIVAVAHVDEQMRHACRMIWLDLSIGTTTLLIGSMLSSEYSGQTGNATRRNAKATMDHADIRGLVTAFHLSVAGLPTV